MHTWSIPHHVWVNLWLLYPLPDPIMYMFYVSKTVKQEYSIGSTWKETILHLQKGLRSPCICIYYLWIQGNLKQKKLRLDQSAQMCTPLLGFAVGTWLKSLSTWCESFVLNGRNFCPQILAYEEFWYKKCSCLQLSRWTCYNIQ